MTKQDIIDLGWINTIGNKYSIDTYVMRCFIDWNPGEHFVVIKDTDAVFGHQWENSPNVFFGQIETIDDLKLIMKFTQIL